MEQPLGKALLDLGLERLLLLGKGLEVLLVCKERFPQVQGEHGFYGRPMLLGLTPCKLVEVVLLLAVSLFLQPLQEGLEGVVAEEVRLS